MKVRKGLVLVMKGNIFHETEAFTNLKYGGGGFVAGDIKYLLNRTKKSLILVVRKRSGPHQKYTPLVL